MVAFDEVGYFRQRFLQPERCGFSARARVGENQRGSIFLNEPAQFVNQSLARIAGHRIRIATER